MNANQYVTLLVSLCGGQAAYGVISWLRNRKNDKAEAARKQKLEEEADAQKEKERQILLADSQRIAQQTALDSARAAFADLESRYKECTQEVRNLREVTGNLIDAVEALMEDDTLETRIQARTAVRQARRIM